MIPLAILSGILTAAKTLVDMYEGQKKKHNDELAPIDDIDMVAARKAMKDLRDKLNEVNLDETN